MQLTFYIDSARGELVAGTGNSTIASIPKFTQGNTFTAKIVVLEPTNNFPTSNPPYTRVPTTGRTIQFAIGTKVGNSSTHYVEQYTWVASTDAADPYWTAEVAMNTAGVTALLGSSASATAYLEIVLVENGTPRTILSKQVTIEASVIKGSDLTVPAGLTPLSAEAASALYLGRTIVGPITLVNETDPTKKISLFVHTDGTLHTDTIA